MGKNGTRKANDGRRCARVRTVLGALVALGALASTRATADTGRIERVDLASHGASTSIVIRLSRPLTYDVRVLDADPAGKAGRRLVLDFGDATLGPEATKPVEAESGLLRQVRTGQFNARTARVVIELAGDATHSIDASESPATVTVALTGAGGPGGSPAAAVAPPPVSPPGLAAAPSAAPPPAGMPEPATEAPKQAAAPDSHGAVAAAAPPPGTASSGAATATTQSPPRKIPIRARGRRPYSLMYWR